VRRTLPGLKSLYRDYLLPAEAALRRALHILAADLPAPAKKAPHNPFTRSSPRRCFLSDDWFDRDSVQRGLALMRRLGYGH
jgi:hypothetical protein